VSLPQLKLYSRFKNAEIDLKTLRKVLRAALPLCQAHALDASQPLVTVPEIEITLISDAEIAQVHADFLDDPTPTDVITFHHGEILISPETAERQRKVHGNKSLNQELALYGVHGLMHLGGWDDHDPAEAAEMAARQEAVLALALEKVPLA